MRSKLLDLAHWGNKQDAPSPTPEHPPPQLSSALRSSSHLAEFLPDNPSRLCGSVARLLKILPTATAPLALLLHQSVTSPECMPRKWRCFPSAHALAAKFPSRLPTRPPPRSSPLCMARVWGLSCLLYRQRPEFVHGPRDGSLSNLVHSCFTLYTIEILSTLLTVAAETCIPTVFYEV